MSPRNNVLRPPGQANGHCSARVSEANRKGTRPWCRGGTAPEEPRAEEGVRWVRAARGGAAISTPSCLAALRRPPGARGESWTPSGPWKPRPAGDYALSWCPSRRLGCPAPLALAKPAPRTESCLGECGCARSAELSVPGFRGAPLYGGVSREVPEAGLQQLGG